MRYDILKGNECHSRNVFQRLANRLHELGNIQPVPLRNISRKKEIEKITLIHQHMFNQIHI